MLEMKDAINFISNYFFTYAKAQKKIIKQHLIFLTNVVPFSIHKARCKVILTVLLALWQKLKHRLEMNGEA